MAASMDLDVAIVGGGPAGSTIAAYLARGGLSCAVFEKERFPRPHVGESLVPSSTRVLRELGLIDAMESAGFPRKYGAVWTATGSLHAYEHDWEGLAPDCHASIRFEEREQPGVDLNYTWHVDRGRFDQILLENAEREGARVHQGALVEGAEFDDDGVVVAVPSLPGGRVRARLVVDASGRSTLLGRRLRLKRLDPVFDQYALHTWFEGFDRSAAALDARFASYIYVHFLPISNSWVWQIPISDTTTSIGVVTQKKNFARSRASREDFFWQCLASRPEVAAAARAADQLRPLAEEGDYSYGMDRICGDRFVLIGDAARFVDPIFSSGVSIALNSARFAGRDILAAAAADDFSRERFADYETTMRHGTRNWHEFISLYYRLNAMFTAFLGDERYRLDMLKLLQGDVYDEAEPDVLGRMRAVVEEVERDPRHPWHELLGELTGDAFRPDY